MRAGITVDVNGADRARLQAIVADRNSRQKHVWRARIVLMTADGVGTNTIMRQTGKSKVTVWRWQERFMTQGVEGLMHDKTRPSRIPPLPATVGERTVALTLTDPPGEVTHWTAEMVAKQVAISISSVRRIWRTHGLQPHRVRQFKLSRDRQFAAKLRDIVGLYVDPPAHAVVLSVDEKSQIQALDRTQPGLPMKKGRCATMTHDYKRHGTTTLFAALNVLEGRSSAAACSAIAIRSSSGFSIRSNPTFPPARSSMSSLTTTRRTSTPRFAPGSTGTRASSSITPRPRGRLRHAHALTVAQHRNFLGRKGLDWSVLLARVGAGGHIGRQFRGG
jgi:transposase